MNLPRTNVYLDASNLIIEFGKTFGEEIRADNLTSSVIGIVSGIISSSTAEYGNVQRKYWFGSHNCSTDAALEHKILIREAGFEPVLLKKAKGKGEKGVDIALATQLMSDAFNDRCERAILISGDEDYAPVVREVRRGGHMVDMLFYSGPTSDLLRVECDQFTSIESMVGNQPEFEYAQNALGDVLSQGVAE